MPNDKQQEIAQDTLSKLAVSLKRDDPDTAGALVRMLNCQHNQEIWPAFAAAFAEHKNAVGSSDESLIHLRVGPAYGIWFAVTAMDAYQNARRYTDATTSDHADAYSRAAKAADDFATKIAESEQDVDLYALLPPSTFAQKIHGLIDDSDAAEALGAWTAEKSPPASKSMEGWRAKILDLPAAPKLSHGLQRYAEQMRRLAISERRAANVPKAVVKNQQQIAVFCRIFYKNFVARTFPRHRTLQEQIALIAGAMYDLKDYRDCTGDDVHDFIKRTRGKLPPPRDIWAEIQDELGDQFWNESD